MNRFSCKIAQNTWFDVRQGPLSKRFFKFWNGGSFPSKTPQILLVVGKSRPTWKCQITYEPSKIANICQWSMNMNLWSLRIHHRKLCTAPSSWDITWTSFPVRKKMSPSRKQCILGCRARLFTKISLSNLPFLWSYAVWNTVSSVIERRIRCGQWVSCVFQMLNTIRLCSLVKLVKWDYAQLIEWTLSSGLDVSGMAYFSYTMLLVCSGLMNTEPVVDCSHSAAPQLAI